MRNDRSPPTALRLSLRSALFALGLASAAVTAQAQPVASDAPASPQRNAAPANPAAATPATANPPYTPNSLGGVTVEAPARRDLPSDGPDSSKNSRFDQDAARQAAFHAYRQSRPALSADDRGVGDPNDQSRDYPGVQAYLPAN